MNAPAEFPTTCWTLLGLAGSLDSAERRETLEQLARRYWQPIYRYIRRRGFDAESAADLTQDFLARFCQNGKFSEADGERGRFRSFLLNSVRNFTYDSSRLENSKKRRPAGGWVSLGAALLEEERSFQHTSVAPELEFDRNWLQTVLARGLDRLRFHYSEKESPELIAHLCSCLMGELSAQEMGDVARSLGFSDEAMRKKRQRARELLRKLVIEEISGTVRNPHQIQEELQSLRAAWRVAER